MEHVDFSPDRKFLAALTDWKVLLLNTVTDSHQTMDSSY